MGPRAWSTSDLAPRGAGDAQAGFTVTELVVVISLLAILGAVAAPRFFDTTAAEERFFADEVRAALSHAQKRAVATGCEVRITLAGSGYELLQRVSCTSGAFTRPVPHPAGTAPGYSGAPPSGVTLTSSASPVFFDALGRALDGGGGVLDVTVTIGSFTINAVGETGLVHGPPA